MAGSVYLYGAAALVGVAMLAPGLKRAEPPPPGQPVESVEVIEPAEQRFGNGVGSVELARADDSHFYTDALVNGTKVRFLIDTGATSVVLTKADAQRAGLAGGEYSAWGEGASGRVRLMPVTIARLGLGPVSAEQVPAMVAEEGLAISLLGQSYLSRIGSVAIEGDTMVLR